MKWGISYIFHITSFLDKKINSVKSCYKDNEVAVYFLLTTKMFIKLVKQAL